MVRDCAASAGSGIADALGAVFATLGGAAVAVGAGIAAAAAFVGSALSGLVRLVAALASGAASLLTGAFRWGAANPRDAATLTGAVGGAAAATGLALWLRRVGATALLRAREALRLQDEPPFRPHRYDQRVLHVLRLHEAEDLAPVVLEPVAPSDSAARHLPLAQMRSFHLGSTHDQFERGAGAVVRTQSEYPFDQVWNTAVRLVRVDLGFEVTERDAEGGFILFKYRGDMGGTFNASLEIVRPPPDGKVGLVIQIPEMPRYTELWLLDRLARKLSDEYGRKHGKQYLDIHKCSRLQTWCGNITNRILSVMRQHGG